MANTDTMPATPPPPPLPRLPADHPLRRKHRKAVDGWYVDEWGAVAPALIEPSTGEYHAAHTERGSHSYVILGRFGIHGQAATSETDARWLALTYAAQAARRLGNAVDTHEFQLASLRRRVAEVAANAAAAGGALASSVPPAAAVVAPPAPRGPSTAERFEWFVRGVLTGPTYVHCRDMVREELAKQGGIRALLRQDGRGGLGLDDWNAIARWFLNARRAERR